MITAFFLATRALINFACFLASFSNSPGWRPTYRMYNKWVSLVTAILCLAVMFAISWWQALITCGLGAALFAYIRRSAPPVNWGAAEIGLKWLNAKKSLLQLNRVKLIHHVKTWRPILLLVPLKFRRDTDMLVRYARQLDAGNGFAILGDIMVGDFMSMASKYQTRVGAQRTGVDTGDADSDDDMSRDGTGSAGNNGEAKDGPNAAFGDYASPRRAGRVRVASAFEIFAGVEGATDTGGRNIRGAAAAIDEGDDGARSSSPAISDAGAGSTNNQQESNAGGGPASTPIQSKPAYQMSDSLADEHVDSGGEGDSHDDGGVTTGAPPAPAAAPVAAPAATGNVHQDALASDDDDGEDCGKDDSDDEVSTSRRTSMHIMRDTRSRKAKDVLVESVIAPSMLEGLRTMLQMSGVGLMRPNLLILPLDDSVSRPSPRRLAAAEELVDMVQSAIQFNYGIGLISVPRSLPKREWGAEFVQKREHSTLWGGCFGGKSAAQTGKAGASVVAPVIDVYWLVDTGGALLLMGYIHSAWKRWGPACKLRVFVHASAQEQASITAKMMTLISKFRITVAEVIAFDMNVAPDIRREGMYPEVFDGEPEPKPSLTSAWNRGKMRRQIRIGEVILQRSASSTFVYVTLPFPNVQKITPEGWLLWSDAVVRGAERRSGLGLARSRAGVGAAGAHTAAEPGPAICLLRGNSRNVLSFYA